MFQNLNKDKTIRNEFVTNKKVFVDYSTYNTYE